MTYHIVLNRPTDLQAVTQKAREGLNPRHSMAELATALGARVHDGAGLAPGLADKILGKATRTSPLWWAIARKLRSETQPGDAIFCTGEDIGVPVASLCGHNGVKVAMMAHYVDRLKGRLALGLFNVRRRAALVCAVSRPQVTFLQRFLGFSADKAPFVWDQTDTQFFSPGPQTPGKTRPVIMSVGLEQRDYGSLAAATADLDVDVQISGFSADTKVISRAFPAEMPANMSRRFYPWPDLLQLYRDADLVVVSLFPNNYAAGVQFLMEALACGRPVVATATTGLDGYLDAPEAIRLVPTGDPAKMREAIVDLLDQPQTRAQMSEAAAALARHRHRLEDYVGVLAQAMRGLAAADA
jgi:glycosyltransferase involved in cell wall biosynthesis